MARSKRHTPIIPITSARSEKADKVAAHKKERRKVRTRLRTDPEPELLPHTRELSNPWSMAKDGKVYRSPGRVSKKDLRK